MDKNSYNDHKVKVLNQFLEYFTTYSQVIIVDIVNISTAQIKNTRKNVSSQGGKVIIGKNNLALLAIKILSSDRSTNKKFQKYFDQYEARPDLVKLENFIFGKIGFIFTETNYINLKKEVEAEIIKMPAKAGVKSPCNVWLKCMNTNMDPGKINEFQNLGIQVKTVKGSLEIIKDFLLVKKGDMVDETQAAMCKKLNIVPFEYAMSFKIIYKNKSIIPEDIIQIDTESVLESIRSTAQAFTALSLGANLPNKISVPHMIKNTFKDLMAIGLSADYKFEQLTKALTSAQSAPAQTKASAPVAKEAKKEEVVEEAEEDMDMGGLFD